jgi:hypothetical protein
MEAYSWPTGRSSAIISPVSDRALTMLRLGFAYDPTGQDETVLRGGFEGR